MEIFYALASFTTVAPVVIILLVIFIRQVNQYERGVVLSFGKFSGVRQPGWRLIIPIFQKMFKVDMRVKAVDVPSQDAITKDNVSAQVNAVIYYRVRDPEKAILEVENFYHAVSQLAQTTMRNVVGETTLDELLSKRDTVSKKIEEIVDKATDPWGIEVSTVELKDVLLPEDMKRTMAKEAEAERERRAVIIKAEGEVISAENLSKAAAILGREPGALHLRTLHSVNDLSSDESNTTIWMIPMEILHAIEGFSKNMKK